MNEQQGDSGATIINANFTDNQAQGWGGGISTSARVSNYANITFSGNSAQEGGGMYSYLWISFLRMPPLAATRLPTLVVEYMFHPVPQP